MDIIHFIRNYTQSSCGLHNSNIVGDNILLLIKIQKFFFGNWENKHLD